MKTCIMVAFRTTLPKNVGTLEYPDDVDWFDNVTPKQRLDLWTTVTSVLCVGVNNPQNGKRHSGINFVCFERYIKHNGVFCYHKTKGPPMKQ